jgi:hypothetical protein
LKETKIQAHCCCFPFTALWTVEAIRPSVAVAQSIQWLYYRLDDRGLISGTGGGGILSLRYLVQTGCGALPASYPGGISDSFRHLHFTVTVIPCPFRYKLQHPPPPQPAVELFGHSNRISVLSVFVGTQKKKIETKKYVALKGVLSFWVKRPGREADHSPTRVYPKVFGLSSITK